MKIFFWLVHAFCSNIMLQQHPMCLADEAEGNSQGEKPLSNVIDELETLLEQQKVLFTPKTKEEILKTLIEDSANCNMPFKLKDPSFQEGDGSDIFTISNQQIIDKVVIKSLQSNNPSTFKNFANSMHLKSGDKIKRGKIVKPTISVKQKKLEIGKIIEEVAKLPKTALKPKKPFKRPCITIFECDKNKDTESWDLIKLKLDKFSYLQRQPGYLLTYKKGQTFHRMNHEHLQSIYADDEIKSMEKEMIDLIKQKETYKFERFCELFEILKEKTRDKIECLVKQFYGYECRIEPLVKLTRYFYAKVLYRFVEYLYEGEYTGTLVQNSFYHFKKNIPKLIGNKMFRFEDAYFFLDDVVKIFKELRKKLSIFRD